MEKMLLVLVMFGMMPPIFAMCPVGVLDTDARLSPSANEATLAMLALREAVGPSHCRTFARRFFVSPCSMLCGVIAVKPGAKE